MSKVTTVHSHGPGNKYCKTVVPSEVAKKLGVKPGSVFGWQVVDSNSAIVRVVTK